jgi:ketosteroid isomerase-like protein
MTLSLKRPLSMASIGPFWKGGRSQVYRELWATIRDVKFQFLQRFATDDRVVDDSLLTFEVVRDGCWPYFSAGQKIEMRLVHIFEMRDGKISKEILFDMGRPV